MYSLAFSTLNAETSAWATLAKSSFTFGLIESVRLKVTGIITSIGNMSYATGHLACSNAFLIAIVTVARTKLHSGAERKEHAN